MGHTVLSWGVYDTPYEASRESFGSVGSILADEGVVVTYDDRSSQYRGTYQDASFSMYIDRRPDPMLHSGLQKVDGTFIEALWSFDRCFSEPEYKEKRKELDRLLERVVDALKGI